MRVVGLVRLPRLLIRRLFEILLLCLPLGLGIAVVHLACIQLVLRLDGRQLAALIQRDEAVPE